MMKYLVLGTLLVALAVGVSVGFPTHKASASGLTLLYGNDLSVGSTGAGVADLQAMLSEQGYLDIPAHVSLGYFGQLTKAGVMRYQASIGVPATGYFGPLTRARTIETFAPKGWLALLIAAK